MPRQNERISGFSLTFIQLSNSPFNGRQFESENHCHFDFNRLQVDFIEVWPRRDWRREIGCVWFTGLPRKSQLRLIRKLPDRLDAAPLDQGRANEFSGPLLWSSVLSSMIMVVGRGEHDNQIIAVHSRHGVAANRRLPVSQTTEPVGRP